MTPVTLGRDFGTEVEILDGIGVDVRVVVSPPDSLADKQLVRVYKDTATGGRNAGAGRHVGQDSSPAVRAPQGQVR
jgi:hypothetical protein